MSSWHQRVLEAAERVVRLRDELGKAEQHFFELTGEREPAPVTTNGKPLIISKNKPNMTNMVAGSLAHRIVEVLQRDPKRDLTVEDIASAIGDHRAHSMRSTLARLTSDRRIFRVARGSYRAAEGGH